MLVAIVIVFLLAVFLTSWILLVRLGHLKREAQASEMDRELHNLNVRYSFGEFSPDEFHAHKENVKGQLRSESKIARTGIQR